MTSQDPNPLNVSSDGAQSMEDLPLHVKKPAWLKTPIPTGDEFFAIKRDLRDRKLFTVCEEAKCPNISSCWSTRTATFMVLGETCTRGCRFCNVKTGNPAGWLDPKEPDQVAESSLGMKLKYVVITMVDRDDLEDGGARHVAKVVEVVKEKNSGIRVELLAGDFRGHKASLEVILGSRPDVYAHNLETIRRLTPRVRDARASYQQSLDVLKYVKAAANYKLYTKSALMLGLGETEDEVKESLDDLRAIDCDFVTLGQYMRPTSKHLSIKRFAHPDEFERLKQYAQSIGFLGVASGPLVRSSYRAGELFEAAVLK
jgi:lipoic acid synthetase